MGSNKESKQPEQKKSVKRKIKIDLHGLVTQRLQQGDQRYTKSRQALVTFLSECTQPITLQELLDENPNFTQSSTYRNLNILEQAGVVHRLVTNDEFARFELAEEVVGHHHHLICSKCGVMKDFIIPIDLETVLEKTFLQITKQHRFTLLSHQLDLVGLCGTCQKELA